MNVRHISFHFPAYVSVRYACTDVTPAMYQVKTGWVHVHAACTKYFKKGRTHLASISSGWRTVRCRPCCRQACAAAGRTNRGRPRRSCPCRMDLHTGGHMRYTRTENEPVSLQGWVHVHPTQTYRTCTVHGVLISTQMMYLACTWHAPREYMCT